MTSQIVKTAFPSISQPAVVPYSVKATLLAIGKVQKETGFQVVGPFERRLLLLRELVSASARKNSWTRLIDVVRDTDRLGSLDWSSWDQACRRTKDILLHPEEVLPTVAGFKKTVIHTTQKSAFLDESCHPTGILAPQKCLQTTDSLSRLLGDRAYDRYIYDPTRLGSSEKAVLSDRVGPRLRETGTLFDPEGTGSGSFWIPHPDSMASTGSTLALAAPDTAERPGLSLTIGDLSNLREHRIAKSLLAGVLGSHFGMDFLGEAKPLHRGLHLYVTSDPLRSPRRPVNANDIEMRMDGEDFKIQATLPARSTLQAMESWAREHGTPDIDELLALSTSCLSLSLKVYGTYFDTDENRIARLFGSVVPAIALLAAHSFLDQVDFHAVRDFSLRRPSPELSIQNR